MGIPITLVDAFTSAPFAGNSAAVCWLDAPRPDGWMQSVAAEVNQAMTAFLLARADGFDLRWFTPSVEVELCGHATLASAHVLWQSGRLAPQAAAHFHTRSGTLICHRRAGWIEMNFPALPCQEAQVERPVLEALGVSPGDVVFFGRNGSAHVVQVRHEDQVRALQPDFRKLAHDALGRAVVTAQAQPGSGADFISRFFAPGIGVDEDPVTGSSHCCLAPYWAQVLGKTELVGYQASARGGLVRVRPEGDRVALGGSAVTVLHGELV